jgi:hypothetical protein
MPEDKDIAKELRAETRALDASGEEVTVNKVRKAVVDKLGLDEDFFKENADWKSRSKEAIVKALVSSGVLLPCLLGCMSCSVQTCKPGTHLPSH